MKAHEVINEIFGSKLEHRSGWSLVILERLDQTRCVLASVFGGKDPNDFKTGILIPPLPSVPSCDDAQKVRRILESREWLASPSNEWGVLGYVEKRSQYESADFI